MGRRAITCEQNLREEGENEQLRTVDIASDCAIEVDGHLVCSVPSLSGTHLVDLNLRLHEEKSQALSEQSIARGRQR